MPNESIDTIRYQKRLSNNDLTDVLGWFEAIKQEAHPLTTSASFFVKSACYIPWVPKAKKLSQPP